MLTNSEIIELKDLFIQCCKIDNPSGNEEKMAKFVMDYLKTINIKSSIDNTKNVFCRIKGKGDSILLNAHLDSVQPCENKKPIFKNDTFKSDGETILGADDTVGIVTILFAIQYIKKYKIDHKPLEILFTTGEEIGGKGVKDFNFSKIKSKVAVIPDSLGKVGELVMKSPSKYNFEIHFQGKQIHGQSADKGVSAIKMMADLLHSLPIGKINKNTSLNIGLLEGGESLNTVAGKARIKGSFKISSAGEIRSENKSDAERIINLIKKEIKKVEQKYEKGKIIFDYQLKRPSYNFTSSDEHILKVKSAIQSSNIQPIEIESFGVSDANTFNERGVKAVLLGTGVKNAHTTRETLRLEDLTNLMIIIINLIRKK